MECEINTNTNTDTDTGFMRLRTGSSSSAVHSNELFEFWRNSTHSDQIFKIQKRIVRIIMKAGNRDTCRPLFKALNLLPFYSQYIFSISVFMMKNMDKFVTNSDIHNIYTRQRFELHYPTKFTKVQKGVSYTGIQIFNNLPHSIKNLSQDFNKFTHSLKKFLQMGSFYSLDEYCKWKTRDDCVNYK
jgi:hypothetical protein